MTEIKWLTVAEATLHSREMGLDRTPKTIRSWARNGHVLAKKQTTHTGEMWVLDQDSLITKIKSEIEFRDQQTAKQSNMASEPVQTSADTFEPVRTRSDQYEQQQTSSNPHDGHNKGYDHGTDPSERGVNPQEQAQIKALENEIMRLKIDVGWRDQYISKITSENDKGQESLHAQARYIGHLESDLLRLGGKPDEKFLAAPTPKNREEETAPVVEPEIVNDTRPHPNQQTFYSG